MILNLNTLEYFLKSKNLISIFETKGNFMLMFDKIVLKVFFKSFEKKKDDYRIRKGKRFNLKYVGE